MDRSTLVQIACFTDQLKVLHVDDTKTFVSERIVLKMENILACNRLQPINRLKLILSGYEFKHAWGISRSENVKPYSEVVSGGEEEKFPVFHI